MQRRADRIISIILIAIGAGYLAYNTRYNWGTAEAPGPGFFPFVMGLLLLLLSLRLLAATVFSAATAKPATDGEADGPLAWRRPALMVAILVLYILILDQAGYPLSTLALLLVSFRVLGATGWLKSTAISVGLVAFTYLLFVVWMQVPLPAGQLMALMEGR